MSACTNAIQIDIKKEAIDATFVDLQTQIKLLKDKNSIIRLKLDEETKKNIKMIGLFRDRRPFKRTATGEVIFPGKKEMNLKLDVMANEILKLKKVLDGFQRDRSQIDLIRDLLKSVECSEVKKNIEDIEKSPLIKELDQKYNKMKDDFDECILEISKYRVKLDEVLNKLSVNEKRLEETLINFNETNLKLTQIESNITNESDNKDQLNLKNELDDVEKRFNEFKLAIERQMDDLNAKKKMYMEAIHGKEYQLMRYRYQCKEKARRTTEFENEFIVVKKYYKKQLEQLEYIPIALKKVQEKLAVEKVLKTSVEKSVENLSKKYKKITENPCKDSKTHTIELTRLKAEYTSLKMEWENMEKVLANIENCCKVIKEKTEDQTSQLNEIKIKTEMKINELRNIFDRPTEKYLSTIDKLQNKIAKIEAYSCFEDGKQKLVSSAMQKELDTLANILRDAQGQVMEIENLQKYLSFTQTKVLV